MESRNKLLKLPIISSQTNNNNRLMNNIKNEYFLNSIKYFKMKKDSLKNSLITEKIFKNNNIKSKSFQVLNKKLNNSRKNIIQQKSAKKKKKDLKIAPNFKTLYKIIQKNNLKKSASYSYINTIDKEKLNFESNFRNIRKDSNIYTSNVDYIQNKKMLLLDKYIYDNNVYKADRLGFFDVSDMNNVNNKRKKGKGHIYYNHNKYRRNIDEIKY
jgi:hypothetical protein